MSETRVLVACVGNIFLGDDAFGVEVARRLAREALPDGARVVDFGIRGLDLGYAMMDPYEAVVLVDATPRGGPPGTLYVIEIDPEAGRVPASEGVGVPTIEMHAMDPAKVLGMVASMGGRVGRLLLVGCEPTPAEDPEGVSDGLSPPVRAAVEEAVPLVVSLVGRLLAGEAVGAGGEGNQPAKEVESCRE